MMHTHRRGIDLVVADEGPTFGVGLFDMVRQNSWSVSLLP